MQIKTLDVSTKPGGWPKADGLSSRAANAHSCLAKLNLPAGTVLSVDPAQAVWAGRMTTEGLHELHSRGLIEIVQ
jgi:hypothetical protein